jgi:twitching motility protein PilU
MGKSRELGMCTFDAALFDLYDSGSIGFDEAIRNADSANELRLNIKLKSKRGEPAATDFGGLSLNPMTQPAELEEREHQKMIEKQESRRRFEEEQLRQLREKKRLAEAAAAAKAARAA